ncbi:hypothetical protein D0867_13136 [Hortaea werneckii]|uniref:Uncharacterized protein n=1 Tax=Hortaea werneckii TaxID=91943 RepID=A0A3M6Y0B2_HORWE|nr:hypothetical protein D0867_13136 [Hortaea werneckii]
MREDRRSGKLGACCTWGLRVNLTNCTCDFTREKSSPRSTHEPGHGPSPGGHGAHPIHIHPARPFYRFAATGLGAAMWFFSETRYASTAWLETPMGALRRDEAL